ncbi:MAG: hypothetical protein A4E63_00955 [Syntrophorhabdus sp. PtaU1.Bin050]|nr:MAG: hypothetical protein A4E63_00955 [Syntrophorhabdus sp. PtaU1.Bin050]
MNPSSTPIRLTSLDISICYTYENRLSRIFSVIGAHVAPSTNISPWSLPLSLVNSLQNIIRHNTYVLLFTLRSLLRALCCLIGAHVAPSSSKARPASGYPGLPHPQAGTRPENGLQNIIRHNTYVLLFTLRSLLHALCCLTGACSLSRLSGSFLTLNVEHRTLNRFSSTNVCLCFRSWIVRVRGLRGHRGRSGRPGQLHLFNPALERPS